jgi:hypothetical protein
MQTYGPIVEAYLQALERSSLEDILALFTADALVESPFLGRLPAAEFFPKVLASSQQSDITIHDILTSARGQRRAVGYFRYDWTLLDGSQVTFECADVFDFAAQEDKIERMVILYDTFPIRSQVGDKYG